MEEFGEGDWDERRWERFVGGELEDDLWLRGATVVELRSEVCVDLKRFLPEVGEFEKLLPDPRVFGGSFGVFAASKAMRTFVTVSTAEMKTPESPRTRSDPGMVSDGVNEDELRIVWIWVCVSGVEDGVEDGVEVGVGRVGQVLLGPGCLGLYGEQVNDERGFLAQRNGRRERCEVWEGIL